MVFIRQIDTGSKDYSAVAAKHGSIFNHPSWLDIYRSVIVNGIYNQNNELIGVFNVYKATKLGLPYYIVPPYSPSNAFFIINPASNSANRISFEKEIHEAVARWFNAENGFLKVTAFPPGVNDTQAYSWNHFKVTPHFTYVLSLNEREENLFANLTSEKRKSIRKAEKDGLTVTRSEKMDIVEKMVMDTFNRSGQKAHRAIIHNILFKFANNSNSFAFIAADRDRELACTFCIHDDKSAYYLFGGYDGSNPHHGAGVTCMWQSILLAKQKGLSAFDFEGSMVPGIEKYFREFGGKLVPYYTVQRGWLPVELLMRLKAKRSVHL
jgi:lipid II:glycine glycyltransferase (peptidoglycan interpeptide bridge formation enzyme)